MPSAFCCLCDPELVSTAQASTTNGDTCAKKTLVATYTNGYMQIYFDLVSYFRAQ